MTPPDDKPRKPARKKRPDAPATTRTIKVDYLARVEGEGALYVRVRGDRLEDVQLKIFEPPRFFEAFLRGRRYADAPDITARICGICPIAYQMASVHAMEEVLGLHVDGPLRDLRRLIYCGEWIESHVLHMAMLHAPDFLGYESAIHMAKDHRGTVELALKLKKIGNEILRVVGGREIHPINVRVGGFYRVPTRDELEALREPLLWARGAAEELTRLVATFDFPDLEVDHELVALRHPDEYPLNEGRVVSSRGLDIAVADYEQHFEEEHVARSNALHSVRKGHGAYLVGPLARYGLNFDRLSPAAQGLARACGLGETCTNPFQSIVVRGVETFWAVEEALRLLDAYEPPAEPFLEAPPRSGRGTGATEAPRGLIYHRYELDDDGLILSAKIVPPTSQNQKAIEDDLRAFVTTHLDLPDEALRWRCEQTIRNYDPCISCATHFLTLELDRA